VVRLPGVVHEGLALVGSPSGPRFLKAEAPPGPPGSRAMSFHACLRSPTPQSCPGSRDSDPVHVAFRFVRQRQRSVPNVFEAQYSAHMCPCRTLRFTPCDVPRMTRGQDGSLLLSCVTLSFTTQCRFSPALVAVGMPIARHPPHRSVRALLTHTALISDVGVSPVDGLTHALNAVYTVVRYCARSVCRFIAFSLIHRLPSSSSAGFPLGSEPSSVLRGSPTSQRRS
jgi:hypothetical protein